MTSQLPAIIERESNDYVAPVCYPIMGGLLDDVAIDARTAGDSDCDCAYYCGTPQLTGSSGSPPSEYSRTDSLAAANGNAVRSLALTETLGG